MPGTTACAFENHLYTRVRRAIECLPGEAAAGAYALSFWAYADEDDRRRMVLDFSFNTSAQVNACQKQASDPAEAKWNFAFWLQNRIEVIGGDDDPAAAELRDEWLDENGLSYTDEEEETDFDRTLELGERIEVEFRQTSARLGRRLHDDGVIVAKFGRPIPIIVHNLEYEDGMVQLTRAANPKGLADEFAAWVDRM